MHLFAFLLKNYNFKTRPIIPISHNNSFIKPLWSFLQHKTTFDGSHKYLTNNKYASIIQQTNKELAVS